MTIKSFRKSYKLTQQQLADFIGSTRPQLGMWETKELDLPPLHLEAKNYEQAVKLFTNKSVEDVKQIVKNNVIVSGELKPKEAENADMMVNETLEEYGKSSKNKNDNTSHSVDNQWLDLPLTKTELNNMLNRMFNVIEKNNANMDKIATALNKFGDAAKDMAATNLSLSNTIAGIVPFLEGTSRIKTGQVGS